MGSLKDLLGDLYTPEIEAKFGQNQIYVWNKDKAETEPIPKFRVNEMLDGSKSKITNLEAQIKSHEDALTERDKQLKDLKKSAEGNEGLQKTIDELQKNNKDAKESFEQEKLKLASQELNARKSYALKEMLMDAKVENPEQRDLLTLKIQHDLGLDKIELDENSKIKNSQDILKAYQEKDAYKPFFGHEVIAGQQHQHGTIPDNEFFTREQVMGMSQEQVNTNIEKINKSMAQWK